MLPTPPPPEPPNQGSQSEANTPEDQPARPGGPRKFFRNLLLVANATDTEIKKQAKNRVEGILNDDDIMREIKREFKKDYQNAENQVVRLKVSAYTIIAIGAVFTFIAVPIIPDIFSLDLLKADIEDLKEDVEEIQESINQSLGNL